MIRLECHDNTPTGPGEKHGHEGPTHCRTVRVDYEYQAEMWVQELQADYPEVVRIVSHELEREWKRDEQGKFASVPYSGKASV